MPASIDTSAVPTPIFLSPFLRSSTFPRNDSAGCLPPAGCSCGPPGHAVSVLRALSLTQVDELGGTVEDDAPDEEGAAAAGKPFPSARAYRAPPRARSAATSHTNQ